MSSADGCPRLETDELAQTGEVVVGDDVELLIRRRVDIGLVAEAVDEELAKVHGKTDGRASEREVERFAIGSGTEQSFELHAYDPTLGQEGSMTLDATEHV